MTEIFQLDVWKGDWGLPSVNVECLQVLAYAKFNGIPLQVNATNNPYKTPNNRLPVLRTKTVTLDKVDEIIKYFQKTVKQNAEVIAYESMLKEKLYPAMQYIWWLDQANFNELVRPWYCKAMPFPFNFYYPNKFEKQAKTLMENLFPAEDNMATIENKVYSEAQKCLTALSITLGESEYFFSKNPSLLDAIVYSYLAPILKTPLPNPALQNHLKACTNLVKFVTRISHKFFKNEYQNYERAKAEENIQKAKKDSETDFPNKRRNQFLAGLFATIAMVGYALLTGILEVPIKDNKIISETPEFILNDDEVDE